MIFLFTGLVCGLLSEAEWVTYESDSAAYQIELEVLPPQGEREGRVNFARRERQGVDRFVLQDDGALPRPFAPARVSVADDGVHWAAGYDQASAADDVVFVVYRGTRALATVRYGALWQLDHRPLEPWQGEIIVLFAGGAAHWVRLNPNDDSRFSRDALATSVQVPLSGRAHPALGEGTFAQDSVFVTERMSERLRVASANQQAYYLLMLSRLARPMGLEAVSERFRSLALPIPPEVAAAFVDGLQAPTGRLNQVPTLIDSALRLPEGSLDDKTVLRLLSEAGRWHRQADLIEAVALWAHVDQPEIRHQVLVTMSLLDMLNAIELARQAVVEDASPMVRRRAREVILGSTRRAEGRAVDELLMRSAEREFRENPGSPWFAHALGCFLVEFERQHGANWLTLLFEQHPSMNEHVRTFLGEFDPLNGKVFPPNRVTRMLNRLYDELSMHPHFLPQAS